MIRPDAPYTNPLRHGMQAYAAGTKAFGRTGHDRSEAASPLSRDASGRSASDTGGQPTGAARRNGGGTPWPSLFVELQEDYQAWLDALPESLQESATAEALRAFTEIDLSDLERVEPPRGYGRDCAARRARPAWA